VSQFSLILRLILFSFKIGSYNLLVDELEIFFRSNIRFLYECWSISFL